MTRLWWISEDGQGQMDCGRVEPGQSIEAAIEAAQAELLAQCASAGPEAESDRAEILAGSISAEEEGR